MAAARGEEELLSRGAEEESDDGWTEMVEVREDGVGLKGGEMKDGVRVGFTKSFCGDKERKSENRADQIRAADFYQIIRFIRAVVVN